MLPREVGRVRKDRKREATAGTSPRRGSAGKKIAAGIMIGMVICLLGLAIWTNRTEKAAYQKPGYEKVDIENILSKKEPSLQDVQILSEQTGLSAEVLSYMKEQGRWSELPLLQEAYFAPVKVECTANSIISREEYLVNELGERIRGMDIPYVEEGDILITSCSHVFGWRNGHAGLVVDAQKGLVLEAQVLGSPSVVTSLEHWESYPSFLVLRLKEADRKIGENIAQFALENLKGIDYKVLAGIFDRQEESPDGTQCAHLVWYAYRKFGYDLDSDGGLIVTPADIAGSKEL